jgi:hypothetical protein
MSMFQDARPVPPMRKPLLAVLVASVALAIAGCGTEATLAPAGDRVPEFAPAAVSLSGTLQVTKRIQPLRGGTITCGRHTLVIPPGALLRETDITLRDTSTRTGVVEAQLFPEGQHFLVPVTLSMQIGAEPNAALGYTIYWYDPTSALLSWVNLGGVPSKDGRSVSTTLLHFSTYRAGTTGGKAGW